MTKIKKMGLGELTASQARTPRIGYATRLKNQVVAELAKTDWLSYLNVMNVRILVWNIAWVVLFYQMFMSIYTISPQYLRPIVRIENVEAQEVEINNTAYDDYLAEQYKGYEHIKKAIVDKCSYLGDEAVKFFLYAGWVESNVTRNPVNWADDHTSWCVGDKGKGSWGLFHFSKCTYEGLGGTDVHDPIEQVEVACSKPEIYQNKEHYWYWTSKKFYGMAK